jgi:hypothetical protein
MYWTNFSTSILLSIVEKMELPSTKEVEQPDRLYLLMISISGASFYKPQFGLSAVV